MAMVSVVKQNEDEDLGFDNFNFSEEKVWLMKLNLIT